VTGVDEVLVAASAVPFSAGVVVIAVAIVRMPLAGRDAPAQLRAGITLGLEFLVAATLLRLAALDTFIALAAVAVTIALRKLITTGLRFAVRGVQA
jgi:hypothetical protein